MNFKQLKLSEWQQFQNIEIDFHNRLTVLTGANGSGKTTILGHILSKHCGWNFQSGSTPKKDKDGIWKYLTRLFNGENKSQQTVIGELLYDDNVKAELQIPNSGSPQYQVQLNNQQSVSCLFVPSHRAIFKYQTVGNIPVTKKTKKQAFEEVSNASINRYFGNNNESASFLMKNTLIGWVIQGYGNKMMDKDEEQIKFFEGFQDILRKVLPTSLGFQKLEIRKMEIVFVCNDKKDEFIFEQASGGISALIDIVWQIYMYSTKEQAKFTVIIDEVENHLHPTMQRQILPNLVSAFPDVCFIVSTHSPLVVGSVQDSNIYVLRYDENRKIASEKLDLVNQAKTATEILDEVLGVSFTMPIWAEKKLKEIVDKYSSKEMTKDEFGSMRAELKSIGLEKLMPEAICNVIENKND
ncbi:recombination protein F [bacterium BMS3Abin15]|nr:recombination protein F [bacterium BMS3Abin15]